MLERRWIGVWVCVGGLLAASSASGQSPFRHSGFDSKHSTYSPLAGEHIDPASGALTLVATDLVLPGNAGFDLPITRIYSSSLHPNYDDNGDTTIDEDSWAGIGWRLHFGRVINPDGDGGRPSVVELGDGSRHTLHTTTAYPEGLMTAGFARYDRSNHTLKMPNGYVYTFGHVVFGGPEFVRCVTKIEDPFGNKVEFSYFGAGPIDAVEQIRQYLSPTQIRYVNFTYHTGINALATMAYDGKEWTYSHDPFGTTGQSVLRQVTPPFGPPEKYEYNALPGELTKVETPTGGIATFTYNDSYRKASTLTNRTRVVTQRQTSGREVVAGTWTFAYGQGTNEDTTVISCACDGSAYPTRIKYRFLGTGLTGSFAAWSAGALAELRVESSDGTLRERHQYTWIPSAVVSSDDVPGEGGVWTDTDVRTALLESVAITRGSQTWTTTHEYHTTNFNDFGQPWKTVETGEFTRTTERSFQSGFTPHILGRPASVSTKVLAETVFATWTYDLSTGFTTTYTAPGSPLRTYYPRADGNLASEKDALNQETFYQNYSWGKPGRITTPHTQTDFAINSNGTVASVTNGITVSMTYDPLFRPKIVSKPGVNPVETKYDHTGIDSWTERGAAYTGTIVDGFGRALRTYDGSGPKVHTTFDRCGRPVAVSMPYTSGLPHTLGTPGAASVTAYEELGRVTSVTGPDSAVTTFSYNGNDVSVTDAKGRTTVYTYDSAGTPDGGRLKSVLDADNNLTTYAYDVLDNLTKVSGPGTIPDRTWVYDGAGRLLSDTQPESGTTTYEYFATGTLKKKTDAEGTVVLYEYDIDNRLKKYDPPGTGDDVTYTYDAMGRVASIATGTVTTTFGYHITTGHLTSRTDNIAGVAQAFVSSYEYDAYENLKKIIYPSGRQVTYDYDAHHRLIAVKQNGVTFADQFTYDGAGRLASYRTGTGSHAVTHTLTYDAAGRTRRLTSGTALDLTYAYDSVGNVATITDSLQTVQQQFGYDALNRLQTAVGPWGSTTYAYHPSGDRLSESSPWSSVAYHYHTSTRRLTSTTGARTETFQYDNVGQMKADGRGRYAYNAAGLVTEMKDPTGANVIATYQYDPAGLRLAKNVGGVTTYSVRSASGTVLSDYVGKCGAPVWTRDVIYAGGRLLGAIKATTTEPAVAFTTGGSTVSEAAGTVTATVQLALPSGMATTPCAVTVAYEAQSGTATKQDDFNVSTGTVTFAAGTAAGATRTISLTVLDDLIDEVDETMTLSLAAVLGGTAAGTSTQTLTITDNDAPPTISISDASATEGDTLNTTLTFTVSLTAPSGKTVSVQYGHADVTATASADYLPASGTYTGTLTFAPGETSKTLVVHALPDLVDESAETFDVTLSNPSDVTLGDAVGRGTINDNDPTPVTIGDVTVRAGHQASFTLTLARPAEETLTVQWGTADDTAVAGTDYTPTSGIATFTVGSTTRTVHVWTLADGPERDETFKVSLYGPSAGISVSGTPASGKIVHRRKGDLNGDGHPDLLWQHTNGDLFVWLMNGVTRLTGGAVTPTPANPGTGWGVVGMGDFNDDGYQDLLQQHTDGTLRVWAMVNVGWTATLALPSTGDANWRVRAVGDFTGDGRPDLAFRHTSNLSVAQWQMSGTTLVTSTTVGPALALAWELAASADLNADGREDLIWQHQTDGWLAAWFLDGSTLLNSVSLDPYQQTVLDWKIRGAGDYNGDGHPDLLWHHQTSDWVVAWLLNGVVMTHGVSTDPYYLSASQWRLVGPR